MTLRPTHRLVPRCLLAGGVIALASTLTASCGPPDIISSFDVEVVTSSDCTQTAQSAVNCADEEALRALTRSGMWVIEDLAGQNVVNPVSNFILTNDVGRSVSGIHIVNNGQLIEPTPPCSGEGGECYIAQVRSDTIDLDTGCQTTVAEAFQFRVEPSGALAGIHQDLRTEGFLRTCETDPNTGQEVCSSAPDMSCGTSSVTQRLSDVNGVLRQEDVLAREVFAGDGSTP